MGKEVTTYRAERGEPLTPLQELFVDAYFECQGKLTCVAKKIDRTIQHVSQMNKSPRIQHRIALRNNVLTKSLSTKMPDFRVSKPERLELLWKIANQGVELIYDKEGNQVMQSPATSVSAVRTINEMVAGSLAPKEVDINVQVQDTRSEQEIRASIEKLTHEYNKLASIEGVTEKDISKTRELPDITDV